MHLVIHVHVNKLELYCNGFLGVYGVKKTRDTLGYTGPKLHIWNKISSEPGLHIGLHMKQSVWMEKQGHCHDWTGVNFS